MSRLLSDQDSLLAHFSTTLGTKGFDNFLLRFHSCCAVVCVIAFKRTEFSLGLSSRYAEVSAHNLLSL